MIFLTFLFHSERIQAQSVIDGMLIQADSTEGFTEQEQFALKGNVQVVFQGQSLSCDEAFIDMKTKMVTAKGNVVLNDPQVHLEADVVRMNYKTNTGEIENGFIQSGSLIIEGRKIKKTAEKTYVAVDAEFTSCATCPPGWSFSGKQIEAELGGYAKIRRPVFKIAGWSVLPLPWLLVPLKTDRQSGLLVPSYEYTQRGRLALTQSFFWAISRSQDATLSVTYHELLGLKWGGEYRYKLSEKSEGELRGAYIKDKLFSSDLSREYQGVSSDIGRWYLKYDHNYELPNGFVQRVNITDVSDLEYPRDFPYDLTDWGDPALENRVSITKNADWIHLSTEAMVFKNMLQSYPLADNSDAVHKMPEIQARTTELSLWDYGPVVNFDFNSTHFVRDGFSYDDLEIDNTVGSPTFGQRRPRQDNFALFPGQYERDGTFNSDRDLVRTGHRMDMSSRVHAPFQLGSLLQVSPALTYREMQYQFQIEEGANNTDFASSAAQRYVQTDLSARTEFSHVFGAEGEFQEKYKHSISPEVSYSHIPWIRRPNHSFFGNYDGQRFNRSFEPISDQDLNGVNRVQFDYNDRVFDRELVNFSLANQIVKKTFLQGKPSYQNLLYFNISQFYDLNEKNSPQPQPWSDILGVFNLNTERFFADTYTSYNPYAQVTNTATRFQYKVTEIQYVQLSYSKTTLVDQDNKILPNTQTENVGLGVGLTTPYWDLLANLDYSRITGKLQSWNYITRFKPPGDCWYIEVLHQQILGGDVNLKANVSFSFGGDS